MRSVDAGVLVRLATRDEPKRVAAAEAFVAPGAWVSHLALVEALRVLSAIAGIGPAEIASAVEILLDHRELAIHDSDAVAAALANYRKRPGVAFPDCLALEVARKAGHLPLGTFDRGLGKLMGTRLL